MDSKDFLTKLSHKDLKTITKELNLHTIIKVSKLTKNELINELSTKTKIKNGNLIISIPEKVIPISNIITEKESTQIKKYKNVEVKPELNDKIMMSINKFTTAIPKIIDIKNETQTSN